VRFVVFLEAVFDIGPRELQTKIFLIPRASASNVVGGIGGESDIFDYHVQLFVIAQPLNLPNLKDFGRLRSALESEH